MLNSYHNFVCDQNSYTNEINFARHTFFMYITSIYKKSQYVKLQGHGYNKFGLFNSHCFIGFLFFLGEGGGDMAIVSLVHLILTVSLAFFLSFFFFFG